MANNIVKIKCNCEHITELIINPTMSIEENIRNNITGYEKINFDVWAIHKIAETLNFDLETVLIRDNYDYGIKEAVLGYNDEDGDYAYLTVYLA